MSASVRPPSPRLIAVTDTRVAPMGKLEVRLERLAALAIPTSVMIQLRDRSMAVRDRLELGRRLAVIARRHGQWFAVNDRADLALLLEADGLHLGERSMDAVDVRRLVGPECFISRACHDPGRAFARGADAVLLSPVAAPRKGNPALGTASLGQAQRVAGDARVYALGGIGAENARACLQAGAHGVAAIGAAIGVEDPSALLRALGIARQS